ncbi:PQQ-binding-like beta-propeller repeat protein [Halobaculum lipolyticum]|uniref:PQQ-binding-like beta-propeller repeat protein n=1 Tax=Halobaculum lipolyticum TaxID=3032001 RepID=A0ABD5WFP6_9EURY|nr:PQQ-binding-like beta-propeller repeat protein [Halobaculum sp. DT31]
MNRRSFLAAAGAAATLSGAGCTAVSVRPPPPTELWRVSPEGGSYALRRVTDDRVFATLGETLTALDRETGERLWTADTGSFVLATPDGFLAPDGASGVVALSAADGGVRWRRESVPGLLVGHAGGVAVVVDKGDDGSRVTGVDLATGGTAWRRTLPGRWDVWTHAAPVDAPTGGGTDAVIGSRSDDSGAVARVVVRSLDPETGASLGRMRREGWVRPVGAAYGVVGFEWSGVEPAANAALFAGRSTLDVRWTYAPARSPLAVAVEGRHALVGAHGSAIRGRPSGTVTAVHRGPGSFSPVPAATTRDRALFARHTSAGDDFEDRVVAVDAADPDGAATWRGPSVPERLSRTTATGDAVVYATLGGESVVTGLDAATGRTRWRLTEHVSNTWAVGGGLLFAGVSTGPDRRERALVAYAVDRP